MQIILTLLGEYTDCVADLLFDWFGFDQTRKFVVI